jgi:hypothetical protein
MSNETQEKAKCVQVTVRDLAEGKEIPIECGSGDMVIVVNQNVYEVSE